MCVCVRCGLEVSEEASSVCGTGGGYVWWLPGCLRWYRRTGWQSEGERGYEGRGEGEGVKSARVVRCQVRAWERGCTSSEGLRTDTGDGAGPTSQPASVTGLLGSQTRSVGRQHFHIAIFLAVMHACLPFLTHNALNPYTCYTHHSVYQPRAAPCMQQAAPGLWKGMRGTRTQGTQRGKPDG